PLAPFPRPDLRHDRHPPGGHGMRVHVIGCSGSFAGPASAASSYLLEHEDVDGRLWRVLMDLGSGAFGPLQNVIDPADLDAVIISHLHPDHYLDLTGLEVFWAYHSRTDLGKLPIHAPAPLPDRISGVLGRAGHVPDGVTKAPFDYHTLTDHHRFAIGPLQIQTRAVLHPVQAFGFRITADGGTFVFSGVPGRAGHVPDVRTNAPFDYHTLTDHYRFAICPLQIQTRAVHHPVEAYGFRITAEGSTFVYSGDTDSCEALDELALGADLFLCEAGYIEGRDDHFSGVHLTGRRAGEVAARAGVGRLALTHIPAWTDPQIPLAEARAVHTGPITMVRPMDILDVS